MNAAISIWEGAREFTEALCLDEHVYVYHIIRGRYLIT